MNYGELKTATMQLVFSESIAGDPIQNSYNCQADYVRQIPALANDCMIYIATTVKRIPEIVLLDSLIKEDFGTHWMYTMPDDFWRMNNGGLIWKRQDGYDNFTFERFHNYRIYAEKKLMIAKNAPHLDEMMVEYYRYPHQLSANPADTDELDNTQDVQTIMPYYIAAQLVMYDDAFRYASLWNAFETRLSRVSEPITTEYAPMEDAYGGFYIPGV